MKFNNNINHAYIFARHTSTCILKYALRIRVPICKLPHFGVSIRSHKTMLRIAILRLSGKPPNHCRIIPLSSHRIRSIMIMFCYNIHFFAIIFVLYITCS